MAEEVLRSIVEQIVQETDSSLTTKVKLKSDGNTLNYIGNTENKTSTFNYEETKEVIRKEKTDADDVGYMHIDTDKEVESESEPSDDVPTDDNNNDFLTTEDEAEDFLKHVLRDTNDSDQDVGKAKKGFELSSEGCRNNGDTCTLTESEERLTIAAALINFGDVQTNALEKPVNPLEVTSETEFKCLKQPIDQEPPFISNTLDTDVNIKNEVPVVSTCSLLSNEIKDQSTQSSFDGCKTSVIDNNNNNSHFFDDNSVFKYDWSKCLSSYNVSDNRGLSTPDAEMDNISPDLSCMMQLSPTGTFGKDHVVGCQRLYSRQNLPAVSCSSTLNTPDPVLYEDTDSNGSNMGVFRKFSSCISENSMSTWPDIDVNNNVDCADRGTKRKHSDFSENDGPSSILSDSVVTSLMNQGRPPDISTWRAVNSSFESQGNFVNYDLNGQWNKPTCTVQPFQTTGQFSNSIVNGLNTFRANQPGLYRATTYNPYDFNGSLNMNQLSFNQYNSNSLLRPSCQFMSNQSMNASNYRPQVFNHGSQSTAAYRLDFSSPVNEGTPGVLNFVSNPQYLGVDLTRPRAVHANSFQNFRYNSGFRYSALPTRPILNSSGIRNFYQSHSQIDQQVQNQYICNQNLSASTPCATQTFIESLVNNSQATTVDNDPSVSDESSGDVKNSDVNNNTQKLDVDISGIREKEVPIYSGCEACDKVSESGGHELTEHNKPDDIGYNLSMKAKAVEGEENGISQTKVSKAKQGKGLDKSVQSNEADSTTIDLTCNSMDENEDTTAEDLEDPGSPTPAHSFLKIQNKYFTEISMRKNRCNSPITSFCTALDLSKREQKKEIKKAANPLTTAPQNILPYCEPPIPVSAVLNAAQAPALAYSGAMLVPYMNSIFAAMANMSKTQTSSQNSVTSNITNTNFSTSNCLGDQDSASSSPLTQTNNLTLNQQVLMYSNLFQANHSTLQTKATADSNEITQSVISSVAGNAPTLNVNTVPLPLYATPIQYPIRPLLPVMNQLRNPQGLVNPCLYRFNFGVPLETAPGTNSPVSISPDISSNTVTSTFSSTYNINSTTTSSSIATKSVKTSSKLRKHGKSASSQKGGSQRQSGLVPSLRKSASVPETRTADVSLGRSLSAVDRVDMSIQGSSYSSVKPSKSRRLITYQPVPDGRMFQLVADCKKRVFKAKHFPFTHLEIGDYKYSCGSSFSDRLARVKFLFSKKMMVYEFQLENPDGTAGVCKDMVEISVPFCSIISLWLYEKDMRVEVKDAPKICLGKKGPEKNVNHKFNNATVYNRKLKMDVTMGELYSSPYHYVQFKNNSADRLKAELKDFDHRFEIMLRLPLIEDTGKSLMQGTSQPTSHLLDPSICLQSEDINNNNTGAVYQPDENVELSMIVRCSCTNGCSAGTCQCCVKGTTCTEGLCECVNCRNPLNILHQLGLTADRARTDPCLMENIYQIKRLDCYVKTQLVLECCHIPMLLFSCIPGEIKCANQNCNARYKYSWCTARLLSENSTPRNHCIKCGRCTDYRNKHCQKCKICYFAGESLTLKCPVCQSRHHETLDINSSTESDA